MHIFQNSLSFYNYKQVVKEFLRKAASQGVGCFTWRHSNVTPTKGQHCSLLQQWRCDAVIDFCSVQHNSESQTTPKNCPFSFGNLDPI